MFIKSTSAPAVLILSTPSVRLVLNCSGSIPLTASNVVVSDRDLAPEFVELLQVNRVEVLLA